MRLQQFFSLAKLLLPFFALSIISCDPEDGGDSPIYDYKVAIANKSNTTVDIYGYRTRDLISGQHLQQPLTITSITLAAGATEDKKTLTLPYPIERLPFIYPGFENAVDSVVMKFANTGKGYYTLIDKDSHVISNKWITGKSSLLNTSLQDLDQEQDVFIYNISQQAADNALDL